jgi:acyl-CoA reductase-like NAD-dependent aldehyde dehydrogenase
MAEPQPVYIGGHWIKTNETATIRVPIDGSEVGQVYLADEATVGRAIESAQAASAQLRRTSKADRAAMLMRAHSCLTRDAADFARLIALESGKPISQAQGECQRALDTLLESAVAARELAGEAIPIDAAESGKGRMAMTVREPLGIIAAITPWNFPLNLPLHKIGPALAAGNAVVHKPSEVTPLTALRLARLFEEAGVPAGAYNVVTGGPGIGQLLVCDPRIAMVTLTGSVEAGRWVRAHAGLKKVTLELGGNSAVIIEPDADLDDAVPRCMTGAFSNNGQSCISVQRIFVHETIASEFLPRFVSSVRALRSGHPLDESAFITSLISEDEAVRVEEWIAEAVGAGARLLTGGKRSRATLTPAVLEGLPAGTRISCNEVFGPVAAVVSYRALDDAIAQANGTPFGLQAGIFTRSLATAFDAARRLETGGVMINDVPTFRADLMPYGGAKDSGLGREGPRYAVQEMTELKLICWR